MRFGSLFSGIGGLDLGLERAGMKTVWQVECAPYAQKILAKHWPNVHRVGDIREAHALHGGGCSDAWDECDWCLEPVDLIVGGFPCQDITSIGTRAGINGARSGLWKEFARLIEEIGPRWVVIENSRALLGRGMGTVLRDLSALGFDAEWDCFPACSVGARHERDRVFIVANATSLPERKSTTQTNAVAIGRKTRPVFGRGSEPARADAWTVEPRLGRVAHGVPNQVDRMRGLGNAVVPQVAEHIGRCILRSMNPEEK